MSEELARARARWLCRRGMKELDQMLLGFFEARYDQLDEHTRRCFHDLLQWQDPELFAVLSGQHAAPDTEYVDVIRQIRDCARVSH